MPTGYLLGESGVEIRRSNSEDRPVAEENTNNTVNTFMEENNNNYGGSQPTEKGRTYPEVNKGEISVEDAGKHPNTCTKDESFLPRKSMPSNSNHGRSSPRLTTSLNAPRTILTIS